MIMVILLTVSMAQLRTSTNTCTIEKTIFKLDIRQRVQNLPTNSTIKDLNASALCQEAYMYDYIWLTQLWTPGENNYLNVNGKPQQTNDYRELQSIKEYSMDPSLGMLTELYQLQTNVRLNCPHMKFLGEFSFYVSADSYLMDNATRFLRKPASMNKNIYDSRYDNDNFVWAINDQMKTIPYAVPWNYFNNIVIDDMKDILYRVIIDQHKLDGIVFLQPSLGLYNTMNQIFQTEISYYGVPQYLQDFYLSIGLKLSSPNIFYMGGEDNSNTKIILQNYLSQIYGNPSTKVWQNINQTFTTYDSNINKIDPKTVKANTQTQYGQANNDYLPEGGPTCIIYYITDQQGVKFGMQNTQNNKYVVANNGVLQYDGDSLLNNSPCFSYVTSDMIEIQQDQSSGQVIFMKYAIDQTNFKQLSMMIPGQLNLHPMIYIKTSSQIQIKFPFLFSQKYKHSNFAISNPQQITLISNSPQNYLQYSQIVPNINQNENNITLNFQIISKAKAIAIGLCNQEVVYNNNSMYFATNPYGSGTYVWNSEGYFWHSSSTTYNNQYNSKLFGAGDKISVTYTSTNTSIQFYQNQNFVMSVPIDKVKNLNFCIAFESTTTVVNLVH